MGDDFSARDVFEHCVCLGLNKAARALSRRYDAVFAPVGITSGQFTILSALKRDTPVPITELARALGMDRTTLTRNVKPLEDAGLVAIDIDAHDARRRCLKLSGAGRACLKRAFPLWQTIQRDSNRRLSGRWTELKPALEFLSA